MCWFFCHFCRALSMRFFIVTIQIDGFFFLSSRSIEYQNHGIICAFSYTLGCHNISFWYMQTLLPSTINNYASPLKLITDWSLALDSSLPRSPFTSFRLSIVVQLYHVRPGSMRSTAPVARPQDFSYCYSTQIWNYYSCWWSHSPSSPSRLP